MNSPTCKHPRQFRRDGVCLACADLAIPSKPLATYEQADELLNQLCALNGIRRVELAPGQWSTLGLQGPAGKLASALMKVLLFVTTEGRMPPIGPLGPPGPASNTVRISTEPGEPFEFAAGNDDEPLPVESLPATMVVKCPRCERVPAHRVPATKMIGFCAQCRLGEGVWVRLVVVSGTPVEPHASDATPAPELGTVTDGSLNSSNGPLAFHCHHEHESESVRACGGCYARLSLAIDKALDLLDSGESGAARTVLEETVEQRMEESPAFTNAPRSPR